MRIDFLQKMGMNEQSLSGKVAVVTGAGRGIGRNLLGPWPGWERKWLSLRSTR
jgi:hypothetical protein